MVNPTGHHGSPPAPLAVMSSQGGFAAIHETAESLYANGVIDKMPMRVTLPLCLQSVTLAFRLDRDVLCSKAACQGEKMSVLLPCMENGATAPIAQRWVLGVWEKRPKPLTIHCNALQHDLRSLLRAAGKSRKASNALRDEIQVAPARIVGYSSVLPCKKFESSTRRARMAKRGCHGWIFA